MTKKEQAMVDDLRMQLAMAKAMRVSEPVAPDVPIPTYADGLGYQSKGWLSHSWDLNYRAGMAISSSSSHYSGQMAWRDDRHGSWSQCGRALYSRRSLALRQVRYEISLRVARKLAELDTEIEAAEKGEADEQAAQK